MRGQKNSQNDISATNATAKKLDALFRHMCQAVRSSKQSNHKGKSFDPEFHCENHPRLAGLVLL